MTGDSGGTGRRRRVRDDGIGRICDFQGLDCWWRLDLDGFRAFGSVVLCLGKAC
jgi:hypothetical protein